MMRDLFTIATNEWRSASTSIKRRYTIETADLFTDEPESQIFPDQLVGLGLKRVKWLPRRAVLGIGVLGDGEGGDMRKPLDRVYSLGG
jgi:hypothetical protein